jgi:hypothetical protein
MGYLLPYTYNFSGGTIIVPGTGVYAFNIRAKGSRADSQTFATHSLFTDNAEKDSFDAPVTGGNWFSTLLAADLTAGQVITIRHTGALRLIQLLFSVKVSPLATLGRQEYMRRGRLLYFR